MLINADFSRRAVVTPDQYEWVASPQAGVERVMLDRIGAEKARATSIVRYAADSYFPRHQHPGGEEILVLAGTFSDEHGDYPAGWYVRNPPGSSHQPFSAQGAEIFVKLWQMSPEEHQHVRIDTRDPSNWVSADGRERCLLFANSAERVSMERLKSGQPLFESPQAAIEILILQGSLRAGADEYSLGTWLRLPPGDTPRLLTGAAGAMVYFKSGHFDVDTGRRAVW